MLNLTAKEIEVLIAVLWMEFDDGADWTIDGISIKSLIKKLRGTISPPIFNTSL